MTLEASEKASERLCNTPEDPAFAPDRSNNNLATTLDAVGGIALQHATPYAKMRRVTPVA